MLRFGISTLRPLASQLGSRDRVTARQFGLPVHVEFDEAPIAEITTKKHEEPIRIFVNLIVLAPGPQRRN